MTDVMVRNTALRQMLNGRRRAIEGDVRIRLRDGRSDRSANVGDDLEHSDADAQVGVEFALLQRRADMLMQIDGALHSTAWTLASTEPVPNAVARSPSSVCARCRLPSAVSRANKDASRH
jgi:hypothetical protein